MPTSIFFPLRSNAAWFSSPPSREVLERRLKYSLMLYDKVVLQDGVFLAQIGKKLSANVWFPPNLMPEERRLESSFWQAGNPFNIRIGLPSEERLKSGKVFEIIDEIPEGFQPSVELSDEIVAGYTADFFPLIHGAGLLNEDYIAWLPADATDDEKERVKAITGPDVNNEELTLQISDNYYLRKHVLTALFTDTMLSQRLSIPFGSDPHVAAALQWKNQQIAQQIWQRESRDIAHQAMRRLSLPDFAGASWETIHKARESSAGKDFRVMVGELIAKAEMNSTTNAELGQAIEAAFGRKLRDAATEGQPSGADIGLGIVWNLFDILTLFATGGFSIGAGSVLSLLADIGKVVTAKKSWVSFLDEDRWQS